MSESPLNKHGRFPAGATCPYAGDCEAAEGCNLVEKGPLNFEFSCALARIKSRFWLQHQPTPVSPGVAGLLGMTAALGGGLPRKLVRILRGGNHRMEEGTTTADIGRLEAAQKKRERKAAAKLKRNQP